MTANSEIILSAQTHPGDSSNQTVAGSAFKGDGFYGRSDGLHTIQYTYTEFTGTVKIQATLVSEPVSEDWFNVYSDTINQGTDSKIANFTGNYVFVRAVIDYTAGTINSIRLNH